MPELKSLLMLLAITVVGAGATLYIKNQIALVPAQLQAVAPDPLTTSGEVMASTTETESEVPAKPANPKPTTPQQPTDQPQTGLAPSFTGKLTAVNIGCFADGECSATVDGKKVVLLIGWYQGKVGKIIGADSIGDLEAFIGADATVYAGKDDEGNYTLLGNESFYLKVATTSKPVVTNSCVVGGCSSQLCGEASEMDGMVTTCEYQTKYSCYQKATCERQTTGKCGWTETPELLSCIKNS